MNSVNLVGRLTRDPNIMWSQGAKSMCIARFNVAVDRRFKREGDQQTADFPSCVAFGKTAEFIEKYFKQGMRIGLNGRIQTGNYTDKNGNKVYTTDVVAENVEFVESKNNSNGGGGASQAQRSAPPQTYDDGFMSVPEGIDEELPFN